MGAIKHGWQFWWNIFKEMFLTKNIQRGSISLGYGDYELNIPIEGGLVDSISLAIEEPTNSTPVCMGNINLAGASVSPDADGFVLYAQIRTSTAVIKWIVELQDDPGDNPHVPPGPVGKADLD
jgi:hypothetical protein